MPGLIVIMQNEMSLFQRNKDIIHKMAKTIMHESFYKKRFLEVPELGLHACKICLDHENNGKGISQNEDGSVLCMISGELYSSSQQISSLCQKNHTIRDKNDSAEMIIHLYEEEGENILRYLNGCFNILVVDKRNKKILVANDRFGLQRLYFTRLKDNGMMFAPELKCFRLFHGLELQLDVNALIQYFKFDCILRNNSFYNEIKRVPISSYFLFENKYWKTNEYWAPEAILGKTKLSVDSFLKNSVRVFESIIENYYTPGQTCLSLTGGLDSRAILSVLNKKKISLPCYTFGGMFRNSFDVILAKELAQRSYNSHDIIFLDNDFLDNIEYWVNKAIYISDGIARLTTSHEYFVNLLAREFGKIRLTGKYGSQVVRNVTMLKDRSFDLRIFNKDFRQEYTNSFYEFKEPSAANLLREELPQLEGSKHTLEMAALTVRTPYMDNSFIDLMLRAPEIKDTSVLQKKIILKNAPDLLKIPTNRGESANNYIKRDVTKIYYTAMNFVDTVYNWEHLPHWATFLCRFSDIVGVSRFFNGKKEWVHYRLWFMNELKDFIKKIILDPGTLQRPWYDDAFLKEILKGHFSGKKNYSSEIDKIISFEIWCRQNNV